jgi:hypothetical protein
VSIFGLYGAGLVVVDVALAALAENLRQTKENQKELTAVLGR